MQREDLFMICDQQHVIEYLILQRKDNIDYMNDAEYAEVFYFHKGKVYAYNEILRILQDD
jgi:hypothetical protein